MALRLNRDALDHAQRLVETGNIVRDSDWGRVCPAPEDEGRFIAEHGWDEYARWHLGIDEAEPPQSKRRFRFLTGDFRSLHRGALVNARGRAAEGRHFDIEAAIAALLRGIDALV